MIPSSGIDGKAAQNPASRGTQPRLTCMSCGQSNVSERWKHDVAFCRACGLKALEEMIAFSSALSGLLRQVPEPDVVPNVAAHTKNTPVSSGTASKSDIGAAETSLKTAEKRISSEEFETVMKDNRKKRDIGLTTNVAESNFDIALAANPAMSNSRPGNGKSPLAGTSALHESIMSKSSEAETKTATMPMTLASNVESGSVAHDDGNSTESDNASDGLEAVQACPMDINAEPDLRKCTDLTALTDLCTKMTLPGLIVARSGDIYERYQMYIKRKFRQEEAREVVAASVFLSCKIEQSPRTFKEISAASGVPVKVIGAVAKKIEAALPDAKVAPVFDTEDMIIRYCYALDLPAEIASVAEQVAIKLRDIPSIHGKVYTTIAASSIFLVCQLCGESQKRSSRRIAEVSGISDGTIRITAKAALPRLQQILPVEFVPHASLSESSLFCDG